MRKHVYPDWVQQYKTKGTSVKKVGENYYLYKTSSRRVPGKSYPVTTSEYIGLITKDGVVKSEKRKVTSHSPRVYEYGLSFVLDRLAYDEFGKEYPNKDNVRYAFLQIVKKHSPNSWFLQEETNPIDLHMNVSLQEKKIERIIGKKISELYALKYVYAVVIDGKAVISEIPEEAQEVLDELGVELHEPE